MPYNRLLIDGQLCDLPNEFDVTLNFRAAIGFSPSGISTERSISLPCSKVNDPIFSFWQQSQIDSETGTEFKAAYMDTDGIPVLIGRSQLRGVNAKRSQYGTNGASYNVALFGGNLDWIVRLGDTRLKDLALGDFTHLFHDGQVEMGFGANYPTFNIGYTLLKTQDWKVVSGKTCADFSNCTPFIFIPTLVKRIFSYLGMTVNSEFLFNTWLGKRLILPIILPNRTPAEYGEEYLNVRAERASTRSYIPIIGTVAQGIDFDSQTYTPPQPPNPLVISDPFAGGSAKYTAPMTGYYNFKVTVRLDNIVGSFNFQFGFTSTVAASVFAVSPASNGKEVTYSKVLYLAQGDTTYLLTKSPSVGTSFDITYAILEVTGEAEFAYNTVIDFRFLMKDWKVRDFLKGLGELFNLQYETDVAGNSVTIEPKNDYLEKAPPATSQINSGFLRTPTKDSNYKWDISKGSVDRFDAIENITSFRFKKDGNDKTLNAIEQDGGFTLYESRYSRDENRFKTGIQDRENVFFAATLHIFDLSIKTDSSKKTPLLPIVWAEDYSEITTSEERIDDYVPRILIFKGHSGVDEAKFNYYRTSPSAIIEKEQPIAYQVNYNDTTGFDPALSYCDQTVNELVVFGLAKIFYLQDMARTRSSRTRECYMNLSPVDIMGLSFRDKILLDGCQWLMNAVEEYNPFRRQTTRVMLELDKPDIPEDALDFSDSTVMGYIPDETTL